MAKARARTATRKVKDKWKSKQWYTIVSPAAFNKAPIAETLTDEPEKLIGRVASTTMQDLTGDFKLMHVKLDFQVERVNGNQAEARFIGHSLTSDYIRRLVRRNHSKISGVFDATTKDGALIRVKPLCVTDRRTQSTKQTVLRQLMQETISKYAGDRSLGEFVKVMVDGRLAGAISKACKPIYPLRKVELNKSEVRQAPTITLEDIQPAETPAPTEGPAPEGTPPTPALSPEEGGPEEPPQEAPPASTVSPEEGGPEEPAEEVHKTA